jgi:hypothetical protein
MISVLDEHWKVANLLLILGTGATTASTSTGLVMCRYEFLKSDSHFVPLWQGDQMSLKKIAQTIANTFLSKLMLKLIRGIK